MGQSEVFAQKKTFLLHEQSGIIIAYLQRTCSATS